MGIAFAFFSSGYWDVSIHQVRSYISIYWICSLKSFLIREPPDQSLLPAPRSVSSVDTPFIASECQGIQLKPLFAYIILCFPLYSFQNLAFMLRTRDYNCGDKRTRTADICRAKAALYQLSYTPVWAILDLNQRPHPYQGCALTSWANSPLQSSSSKKRLVIVNS